MNNISLVDIAIELAMKWHSGDRNKHDGELYLLHLLRVAINVRDAGGDEAQVAIAWLHDVVEDTALTLALLRMALVSAKVDPKNVDRICNAVHLLTKKKGECLEDYYNAIKANEDARIVKLRGDLKDNFRRNYKILDPATKTRMASKYSLGMDILES